MKIGVVMFATDYAIRPDDFAKECEDRGFESVWYPEHTHIPASRKSPFPAGGELPKEYWHTHDLFASLMAAAAVTKTIKVGSGVCLVQEHDPIKLAKEVATVDQLSNGRLLFGIGGGWNAEEMENHGTSFDRRWKILREKIEAMKEIWTQPKAEYHGDMVDFPPMMMWPKPVQKPYPPVIVGGAWPYAARRAVRDGDGWIPHAALPPHDDVTDFIPEFQQMARVAGRDPAALPVTVWGAKPDLDQFKKRRDRGASRVVISLGSEAEDEILRQLDMWAEIRAKLD